MAKFVLTAQLQLQPPRNIAAVARQIQNQLNNIKVNVAVSGASATVRDLDKVKKGVDKARASQIFELVAKFADYGFNKSHAAAYALVREREGDAGRYLFLGPDVSPQTAMVTVKGADTEVIEAFEETASRLLALRADGAFVPRLISPKGGGEADVCRTCDLAQACLRGDSGARGRLGRWFEAGAAAGDEIDSREALRQLFDPDGRGKWTASGGASRSRAKR